MHTYVAPRHLDGFFSASAGDGRGIVLPHVCGDSASGSHIVQTSLSLAPLVVVVVVVYTLYAYLSLFPVPPSVLTSPY